MLSDIQYNKLIEIMKYVSKIKWLTTKEISYICSNIRHILSNDF